MKALTSQMALLTLISLFIDPLSNVAWAFQDSPEITLEETVEDDERLIMATVTIDGEPLEGAVVQFGVVRTFGTINLGEEETWDDGIAYIAFPEGIPSTTGEFEVVAHINESDDYTQAQTVASFPTDVKVSLIQGMFPQSLWSQRPLWPLVAVIVVLLTGVWSTYAFVFVQLIKVRNDNREITS